MVAPSRLPLFELLGAQPDIELRVFFLAETDLNRRWSTAITQGFSYEILPSWPIRFGRRDLFTYFVNPTVIPALVRHGFDLVVSVGWDSLAAQAAFVVCRLLRKPYVFWSGSTSYEPSWRRTATLPLVRAMVRGSAGHIAYGTRARDYLIQLGARTDSVEIAYNTVDVAWFQSQADELRPRREAIRRSLGLGSGDTILYVGQLIERKGVRDLLAAYRLLRAARPDVQLLIAGYGALELSLRQEVAATQTPNVLFAGHVPLADLPRYYVAADCFVLPSHEEVWGLVLNEAAACALPLVTTDRVGAGPDLVEPGVNGFIVPAASPPELAEALGKALDHRLAMGSASRSIVSRATYAQNVEAIRGAIRRAYRRPPWRS